MAIAKSLVAAVALLTVNSAAAQMDLEADKPDKPKRPALRHDSSGIGLPQTRPLPLPPPPLDSKPAEPTPAAESLSDEDCKKLRHLKGSKPHPLCEGR
jgi:hypothetical protein